MKKIWLMAALGMSLPLHGMLWNIAVRVSQKIEDYVDSINCEQQTSSIDPFEKSLNKTKKQLKKKVNSNDSVRFKTVDGTTLTVPLSCAKKFQTLHHMLQISECDDCRDKPLMEKCLNCQKLNNVPLDLPIANEKLLLMALGAGETIFSKDLRNISLDSKLFQILPTLNFLGIHHYKKDLFFNELLSDVASELCLPPNSKQADENLKIMANADNSMQRLIRDKLNSPFIQSLNIPWNMQEIIKKKEVSNFAVNSDGSKIAYLVCNDGMYGICGAKIVLLNFQNGTEVKINLTNKEDGITPKIQTLLFSKHNSYLTFCSTTRLYWLKDCDNKQEVSFIEFEKSKNFVYCATVKCDMMSRGKNDYIIQSIRGEKTDDCSLREEISIFDLQNECYLDSLICKHNYSYRVLNKNFLVAYPNDLHSVKNKLYLYTIFPLAQKHKLFDENVTIKKCAFNTKGSRILLHVEEKRKGKKHGKENLYVLDGRTLKIIQKRSLPAGLVEMHYSPNDQKIAFLWEDAYHSKVSLWDKRLKKQQAVFPLQFYPKLSFSQDSSLLFLISEEPSNKLLIFNWRTNNLSKVSSCVRLSRFIEEKNGIFLLYELKRGRNLEGYSFCLLKSEWEDFFKKLSFSPSLLLYLLYSLKKLKPSDKCLPEEEQEIIKNSEYKAIFTALTNQQPPPEKYMAQLFKILPIAMTFFS